jgi:hypothetical protein
MLALLCGCGFFGRCKALVRVRRIGRRKGEVTRRIRVDAAGLWVWVVLRRLLRSAIALLSGTVLIV